MSRQLIGQVLSHMGKLSAIDIDEILVEQAMSHRRFGEIALSWGLCEPEHLADAWCRQLSDEGSGIDLSELEPDAHAAAALPADIAQRLGVVPIRMVGETLILATAHPLDGVETAELARAIAKEVRFVNVDEGQIQGALDQCYAAQAA